MFPIMEKVSRRICLSLHLVHFWTPKKRSTFQRTSEIRGKKGKGRFSFKAFSTEAEWTTRYLNEEGKLMQYSIKIDAGDLSKYADSDEIELDQTIYSTGIDVKFSNINKLSIDSFNDASFTEYIAQQYAWFLQSNLMEWNSHMTI